MAQIIQKKVLLIGPCGVGKTRAVKEILHGIETINPVVNVMDVSNSMINTVGHDNLCKLGLLSPSVNTWKYYPTLGVELHPIGFNTNEGYGQINLWDLAGGPQTVENNYQPYSNGTNHIVIFIPYGIDPTYYIDRCENIPYTIINERNQLNQTLIDILVE